MRAIIDFLVNRSLVVNLVSISVIVMGIIAILLINREAFPNVNLDRVQIDTIYPGATPVEVERLVITPIERELKALNGIDKMLSVAFPGSGRITLELDPYATNRKRLTSDIQLAVDRAELPTDLPNDPVTTEIDGTVFPVIRLAISAPMSKLEMKRLGDQIEDDLLSQDGIAKVVVQGDRKAEIRIVVDPDKMHQQRISVGEVASLLKNWNINASGGEIDTESGQQSIRIVGEFQTPEDVSSLVIRANEKGKGITIGDIATVSENLEQATVYYDVEGKSALSLLVLKRTGADIITTVDNLKHYIAEIPERSGNNITVSSFQDFSHFARLRLSVLTNNGMVGLVFVFISLILFLRPSVAFTTTIGLPIVFFAGLYFLFVSGVTLNLISMMGFIIVLGMIVDDAIIIGENITYHMEQGQPPLKAATTGAMELLGPVTTTVMTTMVAFLPMLFMTGIIGKFIIAIPIVVMSLLFLSWLESFLILPSHVASFANPDKKPKERQWLIKLENGYANLLEKVINHHWATVGIGAGIVFITVLLLAGKMSFQLFPATGVTEFLVRVTGPAGTSIEKMQQHLISIDKDMRKDINPDYLETTLLTSGQIAVDEGDPLTQRGGRFGQIRVVYIQAVSRPGHDVLDDMRRFSEIIPKKYPKLEVAFNELKPGPPTGRPLQVEISSYDDKITDATAARLIKFLGTVDGVTAVDSGLKPGDPEIHIVFDKGLATYAGVDLATASSHVRAAVDGLRVTTTRHGTEEVDITIRYPKNDKEELVYLKELKIPNKRDGLVPLEQIARFIEHQGYTTVRHNAGIKIQSVVADIDTAIITSAAINKLVADKQSEWIGEDAKKVKVHYGGEEEKNVESFKGLMISFLFALIGIFFILSIQFNNLKYPILVMLAIPFGAIGIIISFFLHDLFWRPMPLSFFSMLGMVAMSGVVVNSSLILLVFVQRAVKEGKGLKEAILLAGRRRLRAVLLTAVTTVVGLLPTAYGWGGMDLFVSPMALALSSGLIFATVITLLGLPSMYLAAHDVRSWSQKYIGVPVSAKARLLASKARERMARSSRFRKLK
jgi:multidrug efflux pump subunit AcrB